MDMKKSASALVCFMIVLTMPLVLRGFADRLILWQATTDGQGVLAALKIFPYVALALSAGWAARIANTPVYVLAVGLIPAQYYFAHGAAIFGPTEQMRFVLFMILPVFVLFALFVSHRSLACNLRSGSIALAAGFLIPPLVSVTAGPWILDWVGTHRWSGAAFLGAPASPTIFYLAMLLLCMVLPFGGREGHMKRILCALVPCFYFSGVFNPIFSSGPLIPMGLEKLAFAFFTSIAAAVTLHANFFLSWTKAYVDDLTQVLGRRALNEALEHLDGKYSIAMIDIDHFKQFNDTYGHAAGDVVLREVARMLSESAGAQVYRYGGEEFSILFSDMDLETATTCMEETRLLVESEHIPLNGAAKGKRGKKVSVTISIGVSERGKKHSDAQEVLRAADRALYKAKEAGRNRVERS